MSVVNKPQKYLRKWKTCGFLKFIRECTVHSDCACRVKVRCSWK